ncbi:hypothetical protein ACQCLI_32370 (plasmid) [Pseudomonas nitroreducens]|uniref:hypothetical protein n=1 Tax=Pseudomonas nitroreducens TaxID=46680 RepID=UPI0003615626|nr:hypothetical protein [Pseudomonas nitroreducens]
MGKLTVAFALLVITGPALAEAFPQMYKDAIREYHTKMILGSGQDLTVFQPDVALYREIFKKKNSTTKRQLIEGDQIPWAQLFKHQDLTLGEIVRLSAAASGYDPHFDPQVNQNQVIKINTHPNSLRDIAEYLTRVSGARVTVYPESRVITATLKGAIDG